MSVDAYQSGPTLFELNGKTSLSLAEMSELYQTPDHDILRDGTPLPLAYGYPALTFFVRPPKGSTIYRIEINLFQELSKRHHDIDYSAIRSLAKNNRPSLSSGIDYLAISPHDCQSLFNHGEVDISEFQAAYHFDGLNRPVMLTKYDHNWQASYVFAAGALSYDSDGLANGFKPEKLCFSKKDVFCLVAFLNYKYNLQALYENKYSGEDTPVATSLKKDVFWIHKHFVKNDCNELTEDEVNGEVVGGPPDNHGEVLTSDSDGLYSAVQSSNLKTDSEPVTDDLSPAENIKEDDVDSRISPIDEIETEHLLNASADLKTLLRVMETVWRRPKSDDEDRDSPQYLKTTAVASIIVNQFEKERNVTPTKKHAEHLARLIRPDNLSKRKFIEPGIDLSNKCVSSALLALFRVSTALNKDADGNVTASLLDVSSELIKRYKLPTYKAEVGAMIVVNALSKGYPKKEGRS